MLPVSAEFLSAIKESGRQFSYALYINGGGTDYGENVISISRSADACNGQKLTVGNLTKTLCRITLYWDPDAVWAGSFLEPKMQIEGADDVIPLGKFWVYEDRQVGSGKIELTCYDVPESMNAPFSIASTSVPAILSGIEAQTGMYFTTKSPVSLQTITSVPSGATNASMLGLIAGYDEMSVRATPSGGLEFYRFSSAEEAITDHNGSALTTETGAELTGMWRDVSSLADVPYRVEREQIYENGYSADRELFTVNSLVVTDGEYTYTQGSGYGYTIENPYVTRDRAAQLGFYLGASYRPMTFTFRGNPALQVGDIVPVEREDGTVDTCYVMGLDFTIDGGFRSQIRCYADKTETRAGTAVSPLMKKLEDAMTVLSAQLAAQTKLLAGGFGGYAKWHYLADGTPSELLFMDQPDEDSAVNILMINKNGIGFSTDGGQSYKYAWTIDGRFSADFITSGVLSDSSGNNSWNLNTGELITKLLRISDFMYVNAGIGSYFRMPISADGEEYLEIKNTAPQFTMLMHTSWGADYYVTIDPQNGFVITDGDFTSKVTPEMISASAHLLGISSEITYNSIKVENTQTGAYSIITPDRIATSGTKNRVVDGKLFYCYETTEPYFGDIGEARVGGNEEVVVPIDPSFRRTVRGSYQVFLQPYGKGQIYVHERAEDHFTVRGTAGTSFGWEIKAKQYDYKEGGSNGAN